METNNTNKQLVIGLDLSFNSTGITIMKCNNYVPSKISFHRVVYDDGSNKTKIYKPKDIPRINQVTYRMPTNITMYDLILDEKDTNNLEQSQTTLRAMICSKRINKILSKYISEFKPNEVICTIENYVMPSFAGPNSLKNVSGLILLQGFVREFLIRLKITFDNNLYQNNTFDLKIYTPTPTQNKKYFTGNGKAEKSEMIQSFLTNWDGNRLLPNLNHGKVDDVIDSFALLIHGWYSYLKTNYWTIK